MQPVTQDPVKPGARPSESTQKETTRRAPSVALAPTRQNPLTTTTDPITADGQPDGRPASAHLPEGLAAGAMLAMWNGHLMTLPQYADKLDDRALVKRPWPRKSLKFAQTKKQMERCLDEPDPRKAAGMLLYACGRDQYSAARIWLALVMIRGRCRDPLSRCLMQMQVLRYIASLPAWFRNHAIIAASAVLLHCRDTQPGVLRMLQPMQEEARTDAGQRGWEEASVHIPTWQLATKVILVQLGYKADDDD